MRAPEIAVAFLLTLVPPAFAATRAIATTDLRDRERSVADLERFLERDFDGREVPGAATAVIVNGRLVLARGFGDTHAKRGVPVTANTLFRLGSTTKMFVAATALVLAEQGRLELHRPIAAYVPELPQRLGRLSLHQLLTHTAGMADDTPMNGPADDAALGRMIHAWTDAILLLEPGQFFSYSNPGYWLAGYVMERVEGRPFADVVKARVLTPVGMAHSTFRPEQAQLHPLAAPHNRHHKEIKPAPNHAGTWPSGSLYSSVADVSRFLLAVLDGGVLDGRRVLPVRVVEKLKRSYVDIVEPRDERYGYGLTHRVIGRDTILFHAGMRLGHGSYVLLVPERRFASVTLTNRSGVMLSDWNRSAAQRMLGLVIPDSKASIKERETLTESRFRPLLGAYENGPRLRYELFNFKVVPWTREGGQLFSKRGPIRMPVHQVGEDRFADENFTFSLTRDPRGAPRWLHAEYKTLVRNQPTRGRGK